MSEVFKFLETNPGYFAGVAIIAALAIVAFIAKLYAPGLNAANKSNEKASETMNGLIEVISGDQKDRQRLWVELIDQTKITNKSIGDMMIAIKEQSKLQNEQQTTFISSLQTSFEKWFAIVGDGFKTTMNEHEQKAFQRSQDAINLLQQLVTRQDEIEKTLLALRTEVKTIATQLAELTPLVMQASQPKIEAEKPPTPIENREE